MTATLGTRPPAAAPVVRALAGTTALRVGLVLAQGAMVVQTWQLWEVRTVPPDLPLWGWLPQIDFGPLLLATLVLVLVRPRVGLPVHVAVLAAALATDQLRLQPEFVSLAILLVATGPWRLAPTLGRAHLASLWLWAGFAKATSTGFARGVPDTVAENLGLPWSHGLLVWGIPLFEMSLGVAAILPVTRRWAGAVGFGFHLAIPLVLEMGLDWAIMPWNLALAWASLHLLFLPDRPPPGRPWWPQFSVDRARAALLVGLFAYPALVYVGALDLYLGHHVYSSDQQAAVVCEADGRCSTFGIDVNGAAVGAAIPHERRILELWFRDQCHPGQVLKVAGRPFRPPLDHAAGTSATTLRC